MSKKEPAEKAVREIRREARRRFSAEEKIRIVIEGLPDSPRGTACRLIQLDGHRWFYRLLMFARGA